MENTILEKFLSLDREGKLSDIGMVSEVVFY